MKWIQTNKNPNENPHLSMNLDEKIQKLNLSDIDNDSVVNSKRNLGFW
jgi:hypothetical protein